MVYMEKIQIIKSEFEKDLDETSDKKQNYINADAEIEENQTQIDYEEEITQIIKDKINNIINQAKRILDDLGLKISQKDIEDIEEKLLSKRDELIKYSNRLSENLEDLDKNVTKHVKEIHEEAIQEILKETKNLSPEEKFRTSM